MRREVVMNAIINTNKSFKNLMKGGEIDMKTYTYKIIFIAAILTLLMGLVPSVAYAAESAATGSFGCTNAEPTITSVTLQQSDKVTGASSMTPQTAYNVEIIAGDANTIDDISQIDIWIYRDDNAGGDGTPAGAWDADHEAIYKWTKAENWSMVNGGHVTTWSITTGSCDNTSNMALTSGEWNLYFTVGKLAEEADGDPAEWDIKALVTDAHSGTKDKFTYGKTMGAYAALTLSSATVSFGNIALSGTAAIETPVSHYVTLQAIANDTFSLGAKSSTPWTSSGNNANLDNDGTPGAGSFSLTQDNAEGVNGHPATPQYITDATADITGLDAVIRTATEAGADEGTTNTNMYMDCILGASGLVVGTYSGTITYTITNGS
jgi:hypothetical protein